MRPILVAVLILAGATASAASDDGATAMKCAIQTVMLCSDAAACTRGAAVDARLPAVVAVDVAGRLLSGGDTPRKVDIVSVGRTGGRLVLHGQELQAGTAWNVVIEEATGAMVGGVLTREGGYLVFGTCSGR